MKLRVLVIDDDPGPLEALGALLRGDGMDPVFCNDCGKALEAFRVSRPDVVLLQRRPPGGEARELARSIRSESDVPIIMLAGRTGTADIVAGLEAGADDYITMPDQAEELIARVRAQGRRAVGTGARQLRIADVVIDQTGHAVTRNGVPLSLTPLEFELLARLARQPWKTFTRQQLLAEVWGYRHVTDTRLVNVHIQRLRAKVEQDAENPRVVVTVRGVGYRAGGAG